MPSIWAVVERDDHPRERIRRSSGLIVSEDPEIDHVLVYAGGGGPVRLTPSETDVEALWRRFGQSRIRIQVVSKQVSSLLALPGHFYQLSDLTVAGCSFRDFVSDSGRSETGGSIWDGAILLARYLDRHGDLVRGKSVWELGTGCGLVGIASGLLGARSVTLTDLAYALPVAEQNVERYRDGWTSAGCQSIICRELDWFDPPQHVEQPIDCILVADCVWMEELVQPLLHTLRLLTADTSTPVFISYQQRGKSTHEAFWVGLRTLFSSIVELSDPVVPQPDVLKLFHCHR